MIRIACTAIGKRINAGRINKAGDAFIGSPVDVTSDCLKAVIEKVGTGNIEKITVDGAVKYEIEVREIAAQRAETPNEPSRIANLETDLRAAQATIGGLEMEVARLTVEAGKGTQDAERYRWLRERKAPASFWPVPSLVTQDWKATAQELDSAIDAAILATKTGSPA